MTDVTINIQDLAVQNGYTNKIVQISGQLDESNVDEKIQDIYALLESVPQKLCIILDLSALEYMNSKSIGYFTDLYGKVSEGNGKIAIAQAKPNITDILQVVGLTQLIDCYDTIESAKLAISQVTPQIIPAPQPIVNTPSTAPQPSASPISQVTTPVNPATPAPTATIETPVQPQVQMQGSTATAVSNSQQAVSVATPVNTTSPSPSSNLPPLIPQSPSTPPQQVTESVSSENQTISPIPAPQTNSDPGETYKFG